MKDDDRSALVRLWDLMQPYWRSFALVLVLLIALTLVNLALPRLVGVIIDDVFLTGNWALLAGILTGIIVIFFLRNIFYYYSKIQAVIIGENVCFNLRKKLFERMQQMSLVYYRRNNPGKLSSRVMNDTNNIQQFIQDEYPTLMQSVLLFLGIVAVVYAMNWQLAVAATVVLPLHLLTFHYFRRPIKAASRNAQENLAEASGNLLEKFLGIEVVKGFTGEEREFHAFEKAIDRSRQSRLEGMRYHVRQKVVADLLIGLATVVLLGFGAFQIMGKPEGEAMAVGEFVSFLLFVRMLYPTVAELMSGFAKLTKTTASIDRCFEILAEDGSELTFTARRKPAIVGQVEFSNVRFAYEDSQPVLKKISFRAEAGEVIGIVGPSGSGKSTLVNMLPRFLEPIGGSVKLDGIDVREFDLKHLRSHIGVVFQECFLFSASILENLRYAHPRASRAEIVEICRRTGADEFIKGLPGGYDTIVGERGVTLSRGQKQLITVTRAMLKDPKILILDEATASIDKAREEELIPVILDLMEGKTTLMITHRQDMLRHADRVLEIREGRLVSFGPHSPSRQSPPESAHVPFPAVVPPCFWFSPRRRTAAGVRFTGGGRAGPGPASRRGPGYRPLHSAARGVLGGDGGDPANRGRPDGLGGGLRLRRR
jgi:ABC-type multidrug transport system fused ATPase/permease subunit